METAKPTVYSLKMHSHSGWSDAEDALLFEEVKRTRERGKSLRAAFERIAAVTGRKSNSIRNYYYMRIRDEEVCRMYSPCKASGFIPFEDDEVRNMLRTILTDLSKGISVRASTMALGGGDTTLMLRYQNKYRSVIRANPELVKSVIEELRAEGVAVFDPYNDRPQKKLGRPRKSDAENEQLIDIMSGTVSELYNVEGLNVAALFESIGALAVSASRGAAAIKRLEEAEEISDVMAIYDENSELKARLHELHNELSMQKNQLISLTSAFGKLISVNTEFLEMSGVSKVSSLGNYIRELSCAIADCASSVAIN